MISLFDRYDWFARISPAFLTMLPLIVTAIALYPKGFSIDVLSGNATIVAVSFGIIYLFASVARFRGERIESALLERWGGWPTTTMLRHRDPALDPITKARYHSALRALSSTLTIPTAEEEARDPGQADSLYRSATLRLIEARRGAEYGLLSGENASYGFRRNMLGMKPVAVTLAFVLGLFTAGAWLTQNHSVLSHIDIAAATLSKSWLLPALIVFDLLCGVFWLVEVTPAFVLQAGEDYAVALFRTLDSPQVQ